MTADRVRWLAVALAVAVVASFALAGSASVAAQSSNDPAVTIQSVAGTAGGADVPSSVSAFVYLEENGGPYSGDLDASDITVTVGNQTVPTDTISTSEVRPGNFLVTFGPPAQPAAGDYDLAIEYDGGGSDTAEDSIVYSETEASQIAASLQIDTSGSMNGIMHEARSGGLAFVEQVGDDSYVSVVPYDGSAWVAHELSQLEDDRDGIRSEIDGLNSGGGTNIYDAMETGLDSLEDAPNGTVKAGVLLTDGRIGDEQQEDVLTETVPEYNDRGICMYTIGFTEDAQEGFLQDVADASDCGFYRFAAESGEADRAEETLKDVLEEMQTDVSGDSTLGEESGTVEGNDTATGNVTIDESVQQATINIEFEGVDLSSASTQDLAVATLAADQDHVKLYDPDGTLVTENDSDVEVSVVDDTVIYRIDDPEAGEWSYELENPDGTDREFSATVTGFAQTNLDLVTNAETYYEGGETAVTATLTGQDGPVTDATIDGEVEHPDGTVESVAFTEVDEGVYSASVDVEDSGTYRLDASATTDDLSRSADLQWEVHEGSPVAITSVDGSSIDQGEDATIDVTLERGTEGDTTREVVVGASELRQVDGDGTVEQLTVQNQTVEMGPGETANVTLDVDVPRDAPYGEYNGTVSAYLDDGSVVDDQLEASVEIDREPGDYASGETVDVQGLLDAIDEFRNGVIDVDHLLDVIDAFATGDPVD